MPPTLADSPPDAVSARTTVALIDANPQRRDQLVSALTSFYEVAEYADVETAVGLTVVAPAAVVVDERVEHPSGRDPLRWLKSQVLFRDVPLLLCVTPDRQDQGPANPQAADAILSKPFRRSDLLTALSNLINKAVEDEWVMLSEQPRRALRETLAAFNGISDLIEKGEPLSYDSIRDTCQPLLSSVAESSYKALMQAVRGHDNYSFVHSLRVATVLALFGYTIGLKDDSLMILATGGLVHDIGKMTIPFDVLNKKGALKPDERRLMQGHVGATVQYLKKHSDVPRGVATIAAQHHEKLDGSGYPLNLAAGKLNDLARMSAIVDVFVALTDRRPYRAPLQPVAALALMVGEMGSQLDQRLLKLFRQMLLDSADTTWAAA
jgi:HD-GYP domain-containing protein (c-di-GMP phosphodiesterase class II)